MDPIIRALIDRLSAKGLSLNAVPAWTRNALQIIADDPFISLNRLQAHMQSLGWDEPVLDQHTYELIFAALHMDAEALSTVRVAASGHSRNHPWAVPDSV